MNRIQRVAFAALLLTSLQIAAGEWPPGVRDTFRKGCANSAGQALGNERAQRYCECTVQRIDRDFSSAEIAQLEKADLPDSLIRRLQQVSQQCLENPGIQG